MINIIACIGKNRELGKDNQLCFHLKEDMAFFKEMTMGHIVVMGRKTYTSIGKPLKGRVNVVVTNHPEGLYQDLGVAISTQLEPLLENLRDDVFIIGGASIYEQALPYADRLYLTEVDGAADADAFFPDFDKALYKRKVLKTGDNFKIVEYRRKKWQERVIFKK